MAADKIIKDARICSKNFSGKPDKYKYNPKYTGFRQFTYNMSYADICDICTKKQSLKKWETELGVHHQENSYPWDEPLAEEHWNEVADARKETKGNNRL